MGQKEAGHDMGQFRKWSRLEIILLRGRKLDNEVGGKTGIDDSLLHLSFIMFPAQVFQITCHAAKRREANQFLS
jgi:hypothetical protein